jgi:rhodanese-related sulfurtransferase
MEVAQKHQDYLKTLKKNVAKTFMYNKDNIERFHKFQKFVFQTSISAEEEDTLRAMQKPIIEFNITNAPISRLCGEFSKQEPSIYVSNEDGDQVDEETIRVVEGHLRHILFESKKHNTQYNVYRDTLSGGFSSFKVWTEYAGEMSFDQVIKFGRTFDPTLTGFDPMAREIDKSDAEFCFEIFPKTKEDFKAQYPNVNLDSVGFKKQSSDFNWSYSLPNNEDIVVLCQYYRKKKRRVQIVKTADNKVMTMDDYNQLLEDWTKQGFVHQPPAIVGKPRWTEKVYICRYIAMETEVVEYKETVFKYQPLVFADGDSVILKNTNNADDSSTLQQFTKPYIYHAEGIQKLTNFSGQVIANDFENMVMHKFKVAEESLPSESEFRDAYKNWQQPNTLVYKHLWNDNPDVQLPAPQEIARIPLPPEVVSTFNTSMQMLQNILGSYDASLGINDNQLSGVAIVEGATQSNAAAMPYVVNYMQALNQVANIIVDLIPKFYKTPRTIPVVDKEGKQSYVKINQPNGQGVQFNYDENALQVKVEAGVNFAIAKNKALQQIIALMNASPQFAEFINEAGLETLLDNIEFRNVDILKGKVAAWVAKKQQQPNPEQQQAQAQAQQAQAQMQLAQQQFQLEQQKLEQEAEKTKADVMLKTEQIINDRAKIDNERLQIEQKTGESQVKMIGSIAKAQAEEKRAQADVEMKEASLHLQAHNQGHDQMLAAAKHGLDMSKHEYEKTKKESKE